MVFDINSKNTFRFAEHLEHISKSALPVAVRQTLNSAAYDVKQDTMPKQAQRFEKRKPTFFKANSAVVAAQGFDVNTMRSLVGFKPKAADRSHSVEDLQQQEYGGKIPNRAFIALPTARVGNRWGANVRKQNRLSEMNNIVDPLDNAAGRSKKEKFIRSAMFAKEKGLIFGTDRRKGARVVYRINKLGRANGKTFAGLTALYSVRAGRQTEPGSPYHHFMRTASDITRRKMETFFIKHAKARMSKEAAKFNK